MHAANVGQACSDLQKNESKQQLTVISNSVFNEQWHSNIYARLTISLRHCELFKWANWNASWNAIYDVVVYKMAASRCVVLVIFAYEQSLPQLNNY